MNIALVFPKSTFLNDPILWAPLGLFYLSSQLEAQGHRTEFFDLNFDAMPQDGDFDQFWLSSTSPQMRETRRIAHETSGWKHTRTVLGGAGAWANPETHGALPFNVVVAGESDHPDTVRKIIELANNPPKERLIYVPTSRTLDWVKPPNRRWALKYRAYMKDSDGISHRMQTMFTSRGCAFSCDFCESSRNGIIWSATSRYEPLWSVEQQIREIRDSGCTGIAYYDDVLIQNRKRMSQMLELHKQYGMKFRCFLRSDLLTKWGKEYMQELFDGGLIEIFVGVESADNQIKANIHKGTTAEMDEKVLQWAREIGVRCKMSFILGLPGETMESMEKTRQWILKHRPDRVQCDRLIPFPGTPLGDHPERFDIKYEKQVDEEYFYKGRDDLDVASFVSTSHLTRDQIDTFWHKLEDELKAEGISG